MADMIEVARKMRGPSGTARVMVLDIDFSSTKYGVPLGQRASHHAFYLRPAEGMDANDLKAILDAAGGEEELQFRYYVYAELNTDLKPLLTADPFAGKYFARNDERKFLQLEGERPKARELISQLLDHLKEPFKAENFPRIDELVLSSYRPASEGRRAEVVLLRKDLDRDELRRMESGFHTAIAEDGRAKEIDIHRPVVAGSDPILILSSTDYTTELGLTFLSDLADYFETPIYAERAKLAEHEASKRVAPVAATRTPSFIGHAQPAVQAAKPDDQQLVGKVFTAFKELKPSMKLLQKREFNRSGPYITIQFPGVLGFGKGPSANEIKELQSVIRTLKGDPTFGSAWQAYHQIDAKTGELKIAPSFGAPISPSWTAL